MKKVKLTYYLVMLLSLISLVSVGFASWTVTDDFSTTTSGMIVVEDVMKVNDYITCDSSSVTNFGFFKTGFVDKDGKIKNTGTITATIEVNIKNCKNKFKDCNTLEIDLNLEAPNIKIFDTEGKSNIYLSITDVTDVNNKKEVTLSESDIYGNKTYLSKFDLSNFKMMNDVITLDIVYTFEITNTTELPVTDFYEGAPYVEYFKKNVYPVLIVNSFNFVLSAKLTGKVVS